MITEYSIVQFSMFHNIMHFQNLKIRRMREFILSKKVVVHFWRPKKTKNICIMIHFTGNTRPQKHLERISSFSKKRMGGEVRNRF